MIKARFRRACARHLRELLQSGRLPESWNPPAQVQEIRTLVRLRKTLLDDRTAWRQRIHAILFHHGQPARPRLLTKDRRAWLATLDVSPAARHTVDLALRTIDRVNEELLSIEQQLVQTARRLQGCRVLTRELYGVGPFTAVAVLGELGDAGRFSSSRKAVRHTGLDVTVYQPDTPTRPRPPVPSRASRLALGPL